MGKIKINSEQEILHKLLRRGSFTEQDIQRRLNIAKGIYIQKGRSKMIRNSNSPFDNQNNRSAYDKNSIRTKRFGKFFKFMVDSPSQPYAEEGNRQAGAFIKPKRGKYLAIPVKPQSVQRVKRAGGGRKARYKIVGSENSPPVINSTSSRYVKRGTKIALVTRVRTHKGHHVLLDSLKAAFTKKRR